VSSDEQTIHEFFTRWQKASMEGDNETLRNMMAEDIVFLTVGNPPMQGRDSFFALAGAAPKPFQVDFQQEVREIKILGDWAYAWTHLIVSVTPVEGAAPIRRSGDILSLFHKEPNGVWVLKRDANMLTVEAKSN
jgi:uncharacterized protein (TIGR02246 family)